MDRLTGRIARSPNLLALVCGLGVAAGFPPLGLWPLALAGMTGLAWLVRSAPDARTAAKRGWLFGVSHFILADNWIAHAFTFQAAMPAALGWVAVVLLAFYLAIYPALAAGLARGLAGDRVAGFAPLFGAAWMLAEWLRSWVFTGYAWGPLSLALLGGWDRPGWAALLPATGTYALSGLAAAFCAGVLGLIAARRWVAAGLVALGVTAGMLWPAPAAQRGSLAITVVQPNLRQQEIADPTKFESQYRTIAGLSGPIATGAAPRLVLWPESGIPDYLRDGYPQSYYDYATAKGDPAYARGRIGQAIGPSALLLTGANDLHIASENGAMRATGAYNSVTALRGGDGAIVGHYAKAHLVPGGEYLPLRKVLEPLGASRLVAGSIDFIPGPGPRTLDLGQFGRAGIQICYEIVFSGEVADRSNRPDFLVNPSNDGWFGDFGPPAHLGQARMRAIEEGLPVLRATTTGISAVIDGHGVVRHHIGRDRTGRIDSVLPAPLPATPFARLGPWLTLLWGSALALLSLVARSRRDR